MNTIWSTRTDEYPGSTTSHANCAIRSTALRRHWAGTLTVKGFAKPVRTYAVAGLYDDLVDQGRIIRKDEDGLTLIIDRNKLTKKSKARAIKAIKDALSQLED